MSKPLKALLFVLTLILLLFSIVILSLHFSIPYLSEAVTDWRGIYPWLDNVLTGFLLVNCLCMFGLMIMVLLLPGQAKFMVIPKGKGMLQFSKQTIESTVRYSFADLGGITASKVKVRMAKQPEKARVFIKLSLNDASRLTELSETIQHRIETALETSLGVKVKSIDVRTVAFNPTGSPTAPAYAPTATTPDTRSTSQSAVPSPVSVASPASARFASQAASSAPTAASSAAPVFTPPAPSPSKPATVIELPQTPDKPSASEEAKSASPDKSGSASVTAKDKADNGSDKDDSAKPMTGSRVI